MATSTKARSGSLGARGNYSRLIDNFGSSPGTVSAPPSTRPPVSDVRPFVAAEVFDKVFILVGIALACGALAAVLHLPVGVAVVCMLAALAVAVVTMFRPQQAPVLAPVFAGLEGLSLGVISKLFTGQDGKIVPLAIVGTSVVFLGVLGAYRTGLVKVGTAFIRATVIAGFGLLAVMLAVMLGLQFPGASQGGTTYVVFGVLYLVVAVMDLFVDFAYVTRAEQAGVSHAGEWFAAFSIMISVVMIYLALLRIFGGRR
jgi:uncharacterized YccA/Bax inhibitor family protein